MAERIFNKSGIGSFKKNRLAMSISVEIGQKITGIPHEDGRLTAFLGLVG
jgi:hypothetical protein